MHTFKHLHNLRTQQLKHAGKTTDLRGLDTHAMFARVFVSSVSRHDVADPAEQTARSDPKTRRNDQPENTAQDVAVVKLADSRDKETE